MKPYTKTYMDFFGFRIPEDAICEIPGCGLPCVDINHIDCRGMGGNPSGDKDHITNLMGMCRAHHLKHGDVKADKEWLKEVHIQYIVQNAPASKLLEAGIIGPEDLHNDVTYPRT